jgi:hypothetical protein
MPTATSSEGVAVITEGTFVYVKQPGCPVQEGEVVSEGDTFEIRLEHNGDLIEAQQSEVWTTFETPKVIA